MKSRHTSGRSAAVEGRGREQGVVNSFMILWLKKKSYMAVKSGSWNQRHSRTKKKIWKMKEEEKKKNGLYIF